MASEFSAAGSMGDPGLVYILTNAAMPHFVKIGLTRKDDVAERLRQLDTTAVAMPFECYYAARVPDCAKLEQVLHRVFGEKRVRANREFFAADPELAKLIIDLVKIEERQFSDAEVGITPIDRAEMEAEKVKRQPKVSLERLGIPVGATLALSKDPTVTCTVVGPQTVSFLGQELSPSASVLQALQSIGYKWRTASGFEHWTYNGVKLSAIAPIEGDGGTE